MTVKKIATILALAAAVLAVVLVPSVALANMGPHGGYIANSEACAGCHRAHTAPSSITWVDKLQNTKSALLLTDSSEVYLFCLSCHDNTSQGADTNVLDGVYEGTTYGTQQANLISGAFGREDTQPGLWATGAQGTKQVTSSHMMIGTSWGAYGGGAFGLSATSALEATGNFPTLQGTGQKIVMDCGTCHDPHGSSNYRILKDVVYGNVKVGGYTDDASANPTPFVISKEPGFPVGGFILHKPVAEFAPAYVPNYTKAQYAVTPSIANPLVGDPAKGMTGWCVGCHTTYSTKTSQYNAGDGYGFVTRHRHPVNVPLTNYQGPRDLVISSLPTTIALAHAITDEVVAKNAPVVDSGDDWVECLSCHNAHGASTEMTGFANVADPANDLRANSGNQVNKDKQGVPPTNDSALLKMDNRGVCEACHQK
ncbi:MAG TPA: cytochrome c3 family protein [Coriobacteriia bacterium]